MKGLQQRLGNQNVGEAWESRFILQSQDSKAPTTGTSLVFHWLRLRAPDASGRGSIPDQGTKAHTLQLKTPHATVKLPRAKIHFVFTKHQGQQRAGRPQRGPGSQLRMAAPSLYFSAGQCEGTSPSEGICLLLCRVTEKDSECRGHKTQSRMVGEFRESVCAEQGKRSRMFFSQPSPGG